MRESAPASGDRVLSEATGIADSSDPAKPTENEEFDSLSQLALDIRWSWNHATDGVWRQLDPELWELTNNPWVVLQTVSRKRIREAFEGEDFRKNVQVLIENMKHAESARSWFQENHSKSALSCVAYFSMEFMLSEALPI